MTSTTIPTAMVRILLAEAADAAWRTQPEDAGQMVEIQSATVAIEEGVYALRRVRDLSVAGLRTGWTVRACEAGSDEWVTIGTMPA